MSTNTDKYPQLLPPSYHGVDDVYVIHLGNTENRVTLEWIEGFETHLNTIEKVEGPKACVITGEGKFFSNGFDFTALAAEPLKLPLSFHKLLARLLGYPLPIIAGINGHAYAGGAMMALSCDYRVMNANRGHLCLNEAEIGLPFTNGMSAVIRGKTDRSMWTEMMLGAKRYTAHELLARHVIQDIAKPGDVLKAALSLASKFTSKGSNTNVYGAIKREMYSTELQILQQTDLGPATAHIQSSRAKF